MLIFDFLLAVISSLLAALIYLVFIKPNEDIIRQKILDRGNNVISDLVKPFKRKYDDIHVGEIIVENYIKGCTTSTLMPSSPIYLSPKNTENLIAAIQYALSSNDPKRINYVSDFVVRACRYGVFDTIERANEFLVLAKQVMEHFPNHSAELEQPIFSALDKKTQGAILIPEDYDYAQSAVLFFIIKILFTICIAAGFFISLHFLI